MRFAAHLATAVVATALMADDMDPKFLRLISPEAKAVYGVDVERYRNSAFVGFYPLRVDDMIPGADAGHQVRQIIVVTDDKRTDRTSLTLFRGTFSLPQLQSSGDGTHEIILYGEVPTIATSDQKLDALLDSRTVVIGDPDGVREAIGRWRQQESRPGDIAAKIRQLSDAYDNWFLILKPVADHESEWPGHPMKRGEELAQVIEEVRGGIRLGSSNDVSVDVVMKTADDATALAAIVRWLPGLTQLEHPSYRESLLADLTENLAVTANGTLVSVSFSILESSLEELKRSWRAEHPETWADPSAR